jgi:2-C-methyl-D-erythritol 4-phosphate cytidylyltransferase
LKEVVKITSAVILAAGKGSRMKAGINKQFLMLRDKPIIVYTILAFEECAEIDEIILVTAPDELDFFKSAILEKYSFSKVKKLIVGGAERQQSAFNGIEAVSPESDTVLIHDGARPFVSKQTIIDCIEQAKLYGAVSAGMPSKDTVKLVDESDMVSSTPDRRRVWLTQTPQAFRKDIIIAAHEQAIEKSIAATDDAMLAELAGYKVKMVAAGYENIKITTPEDIALAEALLAINNY